MTEASGKEDNRLSGKVALVNGAGTYGGEGVGNGAATAILFAKNGAKIALVDKEIEWADDTKNLIHENDGEAISIQADVTDENQCQAAIDKTIEEFNTLDILCNNVGGGPFGDVVEVNNEAWQQSINLNLMSVIYMCRHAIPHMKEEGGGSIINTSSVSSQRPGYKFIPYTTTKSAVMGITRGMAIDHAQDDIRVNCIMPGPIWSPAVASTRNKAERQLREDSVPLPREGKPRDVGWAATFLASDEAGWITGHTLPVDGGVLLTRGGNRPDMF